MANSDLLRFPLEARTMRVRGCPALIAAFSLTASISAFAQGEPPSLEGHWHVDLEHSLNPYSHNAKHVTLYVTVDNGEIFGSTETVTYLNGSTTTENLRAPVDGKFYPVQGSPNAVSVAVTQWKPGSVKLEFREPRGLHGIENCSLSADRNTMSCDENDTDLRGNSTFAKSLYVRD
jgi:hypothetical protein